ncbi:MAG: O-antigen ligase family protein [Candidatus Omnitrophota bacterium]
MIYDRVVEICVIFLLTFTPFAYGGVEPWGIAVVEITAAFMAFTWMFKMVKKGQFEFIRCPLNIFIVLFSGYLLVQMFVLSAFSLPGSVYVWATQREFLKIIAYFFIFFVTVNTIKKQRQVQTILNVITIVCFSLSFFYLLRYFGGNVPRGIINPDHLAAFLGMGIPLLFGPIFVPNSIYKEESANKNIVRREYKILLFSCIVIISAVLFFTMSRGGIFSFIAALSGVSIISWKRKSMQGRKWVIGAAVFFVAIAVMTLGASPIVEKIFSKEVEVSSMYFGGRLPVWQGALEIVRDYPLWGSGLGTFNYIFPRYQAVEIMSGHYTYAHSDILELLSETGIFGFTLFVTFGFWVLLYLWKHFVNRHNPWIVGLSVGFWGALISIFVHSFTDFSLHIPANAVMLSIILALFIAALHSRGKTKNASGQMVYVSKSMRIVAYPAGCILLVVFVFFSITPALAHYCFTLSERQPEQAVKGRLKLLKNAVKLDPDNALYYYRMGQISAGADSLDFRIEYFRKAVLLNPLNGKYHQALAWSYAQRANLNVQNTVFSIRDNNFAQYHFQKAIKLEPNNAYRRRAYARWLFNNPTKENISQAVFQYRKAIEIDPQFTKEGVESYFSYQKKYAELADILPGKEESDVAFFRFLEDKEGLGYAIGFAEKFLKTYSHNCELHFWIAHDSFYDESYDWDFTQSHYKIVFNTEQKNGFYHFYYGMHLYYEGLYQQSVKELERAIARRLCESDELKAKEFIRKCKLFAETRDI